MKSGSALLVSFLTLCLLVVLCKSGGNEYFHLPIRRRVLSQGGYKEYSFTRREGDGVYYADIKIGSPGQVFSVIVDTGSSTIAVPCIGCDCGKHNHFDSGQSDTTEKTSKTYRQCYSEGSCNEGLIFQDLICIGQDCDKNKKVKHSFGCCTRFASAFKSQEADGIIGLSGGDSTLIQELRSHHMLEKDQFSLCLGIRGGGVAVGGYLPERHMEPIQYLPMSQGGFYTVELAGISVDGSNSGSSASNIHPIIDSGTTFTYIPKKLHGSLQETFNNFCEAQGNKRCVGTKNPAETASIDKKDSLVCYKKPDSLSYSEFISTFPGIEFEFQNGVKICWPPISYFYKSKDEIYCVGLLKDGSSSTKMVFGANSLAGFDVIFDHENSRIGFARAVCDNPAELADNPDDPAEVEGVRKFFLKQSCCGSCRSANPTAAEAAPEPTTGDIDEPTKEEDAKDTGENIPSDLEPLGGGTSGDSGDSIDDQANDLIEQLANYVKAERIEEWLGILCGFFAAALFLACALLPGFASSCCSTICFCFGSRTKERTKYDRL